MSEQTDLLWGWPASITADLGIIFLQASKKKWFDLVSLTGVPDYTPSNWQPSVSSVFYSCECDCPSPVVQIGLFSFFLGPSIFLNKPEKQQHPPTHNTPTTYSLMPGDLSLQGAHFSWWYAMLWESLSLSEGAGSFSLHRVLSQPSFPCWFHITAVVEVHSNGHASILCVTDPLRK